MNLPFTMTTVRQTILPPNTSPNSKRWWTIQNQGATKVALKYDGAPDDPDNPFSTTNCHVLQPFGTPGDTLFASSTVPNGTEAESQVEAIGFTGGEVVNVQSRLYNNR